MRSKIVFLLLFASCVYSQAADSTQVKVFRRLYGGITFTPGAAYRLLSYNPNYDKSFGNAGTPAEIQGAINLRNSDEKPTFGFTTGIKLGVWITDFFSIESGFDYSMKGWQLKRDNLKTGYNYNPYGLDTSKTYSLLFKEARHYFVLPVAFNFTLGKGKVKALISTGVNMDIMIAVSTHTTFTSSDGESTRSSRISTDIEYYHRFNISPFLGVGIEYDAFKFPIKVKGWKYEGHCFLRVMPMAQMQALQSSNTPIVTRFWSAGINTALILKVAKLH